MVAVKMVMMVTTVIAIFFGLVAQLVRAGDS